MSSPIVAMGGAEMLDGELVEMVRSRETSSAFLVAPAGQGEVSEKRLPGRLLPAHVHTDAEIGIEEMRERRQVRTRAGTRAGRAGRRR